MTPTTTPDAGWIITLEDDGSPTILARDERRQRSTHRAYAARHFGKTPTAVHRVGWTNKHGVKVVATRWNA